MATPEHFGMASLHLATQADAPPSNFMFAAVEPIPVVNNLHHVKLAITRFLTERGRQGLRHFECISYLQKHVVGYVPHMVSQVLVELERDQILHYEFSRGRYFPTTQERAEQYLADLQAALKE